jgi:hypothetical protein
MDQCRLWKRLRATTDNTTPSSSIKAPVHWGCRIPSMSLTLSRLRAVPLTPRRGDYFEISTGVRPQGRQARKHFLRESRRLGAGGCFGYGHVGTESTSVGRCGNTKVIFRKYCGRRCTVVRPPETPMEAWCHMKFGKRAVQGPVSLTFYQTANCIAS